MKPDHRYPTIARVRRRVVAGETLAVELSLMRAEDIADVLWEPR